MKYIDRCPSCGRLGSIRVLRVKARNAIYNVFDTIIDGSFSLPPEISHDDIADGLFKCTNCEALRSLPELMIPDADSVKSLDVDLLRRDVASLIGTGTFAPRPQEEDPKIQEEPDECPELDDEDPYEHENEETPDSPEPAYPARDFDIYSTDDMDEMSGNDLSRLINCVMAELRDIDVYRLLTIDWINQTIQASDRDIFVERIREFLSNRDDDERKSIYGLTHQNRNPVWIIDFCNCEFTFRERR